MIIIRKTLLECGTPTPYDTNPKNKRLNFNTSTSIEVYILQASFYNQEEE
ncbi:hypothetical protein GCM10023261_04270 [Bartonella jaculi]|uniref:Uncharacterized protein n=1 Tax=Bartonella jaculi TaxID=686226 RepID=A0ABP9N4T9_9HYPH